MIQTTTKGEIHLKDKIMEKYTYNDFKARISIIEVALSLGYRFDKSKGHSRPNFVLRGKAGEETDRIIITNPNNPSQQGYWRRNTTPGRSSGDLISFVRENLSSFHSADGRINEIDGINKVLLYFAGISSNRDYNNRTFLDMNNIHPAKPFVIERYDREIGADNIDKIMNILSTRALKKETIEKFSPFIERIRDRESQYSFKNIAFPYREPGNDKILGYEIRGLKGFKGKAEGSNSTTAAWIAVFTKKSKEVTNIYFAESALDIMAFWQYNRAIIDTNKSAFISTGGSFSDQQIKKILSFYSNAKAVDCFDNDLQGKLYGCRLAALTVNKELKTSVNGDNIVFEMDGEKWEIDQKKIEVNTFILAAELNKNKIEIFKAPSNFKDWNDVIMNHKLERGNNKQDKAQHLEELTEKRKTNTFKR